MGVYGAQAIRVLNSNDAPQGAFHPRVDYGSIEYRFDGRPFAGGKVDASVEARTAADGVLAQPIPRMNSSLCERHNHTVTAFQWVIDAREVDFIARLHSTRGYSGVVLHQFLVIDAICLG